MGFVYYSRGYKLKNIINELIQIESGADAAIEEVREEMKHMDEAARKREARIRADINNRVTEKVDKLHEEANKESTRKIAEIKQNSDSMTASLEELFEQNRLKWEADIVNQVLRA